jgi:serine/threonine-protein phosphatase 2A regulatory subunit A
MDENNEEDCTIYIEELKSDDPNLKINAVSKICTIAEILGPVRVCSEFVPYLIEIIEEQDNEDEFLIKLANEILNLKKFVGGKDKQHILIAPLEILSSMEESLVREKAVQCLIALTEGQNEGNNKTIIHLGFFENHFFVIVQQLG